MAEFDYSVTLFSQWANSPVMLQVLQNYSDTLDPSDIIDQFFYDVWNIATAKDYGLNFWGAIVGVGRVIPVQVSKYFGFNEAGDLSADPFGQSPFYPGFSGTTNYALLNDDYRQLIYAKAAANIWDGSIPGLNSILRLLFPGQVCYATDDGNMSMTYVFAFSLTPVQESIIFTTGVLPQPVGVSVAYSSM